jgi:hypothetical protein
LEFGALSLIGIFHSELTFNIFQLLEELSTNFLEDVPKVLTLLLGVELSFGKGKGEKSCILFFSWVFLQGYM